jgi:protein TonB
VSSRIELRRDSVAAIVLDASRCRVSRTYPTNGSLLPNSLASIVLGDVGSRRVHSIGAGLLGAAVLYVGIAATMRWSGDRSAHAIAHAAKPLQIDHVLDLDPPASPDPPTELPKVPEAPRPRAEPAPRTALAPRDHSPNPSAPAVAGQVVAAEPEAAEALDFTSFDIATGQGREYAGGVTASSGTNTTAVHSPRVDRDARPGATGGAGSRARPVGLPATDWSCPWPHEADALSIDEETVVIRVVVRPNGAVVSADLVSDPGHGFGPVALACARSQRFPPALDDAGAPITATSPPVRVHFTRSTR